MPDSKPQEELPDDVPENERAGGEPTPSGSGKHDPETPGGNRSRQQTGNGSKPRGKDRAVRGATSMNRPFSLPIEDFFYWLTGIAQAYRMSPCFKA